MPKARNKKPVSGFFYVLYLLHIPEHPYKAKAITYRTCHTSELAVINK
jgi:hypothetical protein